MPRLFVALRPPATIRAALAGTMTAVPDVRWQDDDQLHLTVRFLGEVAPRAVDDVVAALGTVGGARIAARLAGVGCFDRRGRVDTLWAGVAPRVALSALHRKVDQALSVAGIAPDTRAYHPHITLARLARGANAGAAIERWLVAHAALASPAFTFDRLSLVESTLGPGGASYTPLAIWPFG